MTLTLVGMSNVGKSYWSQALAEKGYNRFCCDDLIEHELTDVLNELGYSGIADMSKWLGQPYDERFAANQQTYLDLETKAMETIINQLRSGELTGDIVIDTTGSVVHTDPTVREALSELTTVIYLEATADMQAEMFKMYIAEPKPVVWGDIFQPQPGETAHETLARCYPELLAYRSERYADMSHVTISRDTLRAMKNADEFLELCVLE